MKKLGSIGIGIIIAALAGAALRLPRLAQRPMHVDEAVHAVKLGKLLEKGEYVYDPDEYHGPSLYYFTLPVAWAQGVHKYPNLTEPILRVAPAAFGIGLILLIFLFRQGLDPAAATIGAILAALSPALVYYSRYFIQEILLVFFTYLTLAAGWRYYRSRKIGWALLAGLGIGLMHATKETDFIAYGCFIIAAVFTRLVSRNSNIKILNSKQSSQIRPNQAESSQNKEEKRVQQFGDSLDSSPERAEGFSRGRQPPEVVKNFQALQGRKGASPSSKPLLHIIFGLSVALLTSILLFSAFGHNLRGPLDSILTYGHYFQRAGSNGIHDHPWWFYLRMLTCSHDRSGPLWSEGLIFGLAVAGFVIALLKKTYDRGDLALVRFVGFFTFLSLLVYSAIPYKTPWCMLTSLFGMTLLAGFAAVEIINALRPAPLQFLAFGLLLLGMYNLGQQASRSIGRFAADQRNPYVYAHTSGDLLHIPERAAQIALFDSAGQKMLIQVISPTDDFWPLPWYLRQFPNVGYWQEIPPNPDASIIIASADIQDLVAARLKDKYFMEIRGLRPHVKLAVFIKKDLWVQFIEIQKILAAEGQTR